MLVYSDMILLDLAGPLIAFNIMQADIQLIARSSQAVMTDVGPPVTPTANFETTAKDLDVLFVPGGLKGTIAAMKDTQTVDFVREQGRAARYVTSLHRIASAWSGGAAERLSGYVPLVCPDLLAHMGAVVRKDRVVEDRNRLTAGGVTAGIDLALTIAERVAGDELARRMQLLIEYDPRPPFDSGSPEHAGPKITEAVLARRSDLIREAETAAKAAGASMNL